jgi:hypothetical protein
MITINTFFDKAIFTNCDHRTDRLAQFTAETAKFGITAERFKGLVYGNPHNLPCEPGNFNVGVIGTIQTMRNAVIEAKELGLKNFMFFEDDAVFHENFIELFDKFIRQVPDDWCLLYLGGWNTVATVPVSENISRVSETYYVHAIGIHSRVYDEIIELFAPPVITRNGDVMLTDIQKKHPCYIFNPRLVYQSQGMSDVWGQVLNFDQYLKDR